MDNETNTRNIVARLKREGSQQAHGGNHDKFDHPAKPDLTIIVPRHRELSPDVARSIATKAGWIR